MTQKHWSEVKESGSVTGMNLMLSIHRRLGDRGYDAILFFVSIYYWFRNPLARRASRQYQKRLRAAYPALKLPMLPTLRHFMAFGIAMRDKVRALHGDIPREQVTMVDRDTLRAAIESGQGGLMMVSHLGNHEICQALSALRHDLKLSVLMHTQHAQRFNTLLNQGTGPRPDVIEVTHIGPETAQRLQARIDEGGFVVIAGDREPIGLNGRTRDVSFLGHDARFPEGGFWLASLLRCPTYFLLCARDKRQYNVHFEALGDARDLKRRDRAQWITDQLTRYAGRLEHYCARYPLEWFNFYPFWATPTTNTTSTTAPTEPGAGSPL
ncbi:MULTISPECIES: glycosyl transferase [Larsenimonas]|uniref:Glycosyl transferase n=1 Tax=Larsenimonas suaedae TaxID=1851019 RepID=A0ABU1GWS9_9GAMM|nr:MULTISPECIES: glycosyl transferase [Larsenimonas]MCM2973052.1 glycosyl transferase [Larsenimonas suaedae]MCM5705009.1 glycosyl transferase [Larsenimonas salina]MDR5896489.1 glycosyl transferase [Larsenimonas suaedae]